MRRQEKRERGEERLEERQRKRAHSRERQVVAETERILKGERLRGRHDAETGEEKEGDRDTESTVPPPVAYN